MRRRQFLSLGAATLTATSLFPESVFAGSSTRTLSVFDTHSQSALDATYWVDGWYNPDVLKELNALFRDWRTGETIAIDPALFDILWALQRKADGKALHLLCGYRSPTTNAMMSQRSRGVARNSFHVAGRAADIRVPDYSLRGLRNAAVDLSMGGVGYYPRSNFVHVDTGDVRTW